MDEYIKREDAITQIEADCLLCRKYGADREGIRCPFCKTGIDLDVLRKQPAADVVTVRHGRWTDHRTIEHDGEWYCSACGKEITIYMGADRTDRYTYCPNCGARMDGDA